MLLSHGYMNKRKKIRMKVDQLVNLEIHFKKYIVIKGIEEHTEII